MCYKIDSLGDLDSAIYSLAKLQSLVVIVSMLTQAVFCSMEPFSKQFSNFQEKDWGKRNGFTHLKIIVKLFYMKFLCL